MKRFLCIIFAVLSLLFAGCKAEGEDSGKIKVVATLFPQYDFVSKIGAERVEAVKLLPWGADSHSYEATVKDMRNIASADLFLYTGDEMEPWASKLLDASAGKNTRVVDLSEGIVMQYLHEDTHSHPDPHIWTSPENAIIMARQIEEVLTELDPEGSEYYRKNAEGLILSLGELSERFRAASEALDGKTVYFGGRFAFLYAFREYGINYLGVYDGCAEDTEPGIKRINEIVDHMRKSGAEVIFYEEMSAGKIAESIADEVGAQALLLHSCHNLSSDEAKAGEDYLSLMSKNIEMLWGCS